MGEAGAYDQLNNVSGGFGGIVPVDPSFDQPAHWLNYITTLDVDALCARAPQLGGAIEAPPFEIPGVGRLAILTDPTGARFVAMQYGPGASPAAVSLPPRPGEPAWHELTTSDPDAAVPFYRELFGYDHRPAVMDDFTYHLLMLGDQPVAGIMKAPEGAPIAHWTIYFEVADAAAAQTGIAELGGENATPVMPVPGTGLVALAKDPHGAYFAIMQSDPM
jgi:predicted enzyme related to lactoylglutathione lyase